MQRYSSQHVEDFADQLRRGPRHLVLRQLHNIAHALTVVEAGQRYRLSAARTLVTGLPATASDDHEPTVRGKDLRADLIRLAEDLSGNARLPEQACGETMHYPEALAERFQVSRKTISRWRDRGLCAWKVVGADGRLRVAFPERSVRMFVQQNTALIERAASFTQLSENDLARIVERAREITATASSSRNAVIEQVAAEVGRARETVRQVLMRHERDCPEQRIFSEPQPSTAGDWQRLRVWEACQDGASVATIAERFDITPQEAYAVVTEMRARTLQRQEIEFIDSDTFRASDADQAIRANPVADHPYVEVSNKVRVPADLPPFLAELYRRPLLTAEGEQALFRKMNYLKFRADVRRQAIDPEQVSASELDQVEALLDEAAGLKNRIVCANLRLVVHVARRHLDSGRDLFELISDGNETLMRAVDKFDFNRGFKFSTYCTWALMRRFARRGQEQQRRRAMFVTGQEECLRDVVAAPQSDETMFARELVSQMAAELSDRQWQVLRQRFGLGRDGQPQTLTEIGRDLGVSKERVRQIENESLAQLRAKFSGQVDQLFG